MGGGVEVQGKHGSHNEQGLRKESKGATAAACLLVTDKLINGQSCAAAASDDSHLEDEIVLRSLTLSSSE